MSPLGHSHRSRGSDPERLATELHAADPQLAGLFLDERLHSGGLDRLLPTDQAAAALERRDEREAQASGISSEADRHTVAAWRCDFAVALCKLLTDDQRVSAR